MTRRCRRWYAGSGARSDSPRHFVRVDPLIEDAAPLTRLGFRLAPRQVQPRATIVVDLTPPAKPKFSRASIRQVRYNAGWPSAKRSRCSRAASSWWTTSIRCWPPPPSARASPSATSSYFRQLVSDFGDDDAELPRALMTAKSSYGAHRAASARRLIISMAQSVASAK